MKSGLTHMAIVAASTLGVLSITYALPDVQIAEGVGTLGDLRPWIAGEDVPFAMWWEGRPTKDQEEVLDEALLAEAAAAAEEEDEDEDELRAPPPRTPDPVVVEVQPPPKPPKPDTPDTPDTPEPVAAPIKPAPPKPRPPAVVIDPDLYAGITREIEDPTGTAMEPFYLQLRRTALKQDSAITRISHWGASVIGADGMTSDVRRKLQARFGSAGKGWVNVAPGWDWYRQKDVVYKPKGWRGRTVTSHKLKNRRHGKARYGYGGVAALGGGGSKSSYRVYARRLELYYHAYPRGGDVSIKVDGGDPIIFSTKSEVAQDAWRVVEAEGDGEHTFVVAGKGNSISHLYGVTLERDGPGIVYDCIGMIGTRSSRILNYDPEHLKTQVAHRKPNLQIIMFGGNELVDKGMNMRIYGEKYDRVIKRLRAGAPDAACMMMTPVDHGEKHRGRVRTVKMLKKMIPVQQRIAEQNGCAFFNTYEAMGGEGTMGRWYYKVKPRLAWGDFAHLTKAGDRVLGAMIYKALIKGFADFIARPPQPSDAP